MELPTIKGQIKDYDILHIEFEPPLPESCQMYFKERAEAIYAGNIKTNEIDKVLYYLQRLMQRAYDQEILWYSPIKERWVWDPLRTDKDGQLGRIPVFPGTFE